MSITEIGVPVLAGAAWLVTYLLHSTVLLGLVAGFRRVRALPAGLEQTLWRTALAGALITATLVSFGWEGGALGTRVQLVPTLPAPAMSWVPAAIPGAATNLTAHIAPAGAFAILALWAATAGWGLLRLARARRRLHRALGPRVPVTDGEIRRLLDRLCRNTGVTRAVRLTVSSRLASPIAVGRSEICFPRRLMGELSPEEIETALAHELGHLQHGGPLWKGFAAGLAAVFFFQPLLALARRGMEESAEFLADDWAVRQTGSGISLARCLAAVASRQAPEFRPATVPGAAVASVASGMADGDSPLVRRVERILGQRPWEPSPALRFAGAAAVLAAVWLAAPGVSAIGSNGRGGAEAPALVLAGAAPAPASAFALLAPPEARPERTIIVVVPRSAPPARAPRFHSAPRRERIPLAGPHAGLHLRDEDTAPRAPGAMLPHFRMRARDELLRKLVLRRDLDEATLRDLKLLEQGLLRMERELKAREGALLPSAPGLLPEGFDVPIPGEPAPPLVPQAPAPVVRI